MTVLRAYRQLLRNGPLTRLLVGEFVSSIGDWLYLVAILILVYQVTEDPFILGLVGAARVLPYLVLSIPAGIVADRFDRRLVLLSTDVARGLLMLVIAAIVFLDGPIWLVIALAIGGTCFATFFGPAIGAYLPNLVEDEDQLGPANSAWSTLDNLAFMVGPAVAGILIATGGLVVAFLLNAASFAVIAVVLWGLPRNIAAASPETSTVAPDAAPGVTRRGRGGGRTSGARGPPCPRHRDARARAGHRARPHRHRRVGRGRRPLGPHGHHRHDIARRRRGGDRLPERRDRPRRLHRGARRGRAGAAPQPRPGAGRWVAACSRSASRPSGYAPALGVAIAAIAIAAAGSLVVEVTSTTIFQRVVPDAIRGRTLGVLGTVSTVAFAVGSFVMPVASDAVGTAPILAACGVAVAVAGLVGALMAASAARRRAGSTADVRVNRLAGLPLFAGVPAASLEAVAVRMEPVRVTAGEIVIREGDVADRFYLIDEGSFVVTRLVASESAIGGHCGRAPADDGAGRGLRRDRPAARHPADRDRGGGDRRRPARPRRGRLPGARERRPARAPATPGPATGSAGRGLLIWPRHTPDRNRRRTAKESAAYRAGGSEAVAARIAFTSNGDAAGCFARTRAA